jgi:hypothetical protein
MKRNENWPRGEKLAAWGIAVAALVGLLPLLFPEVRIWLHLEKFTAARVAVSTPASTASVVLPPTLTETSKVHTAGNGKIAGNNNVLGNNNHVNAPPASPVQINNAPNGIAIGGGTVNNPTVINSEPPPPSAWNMSLVYPNTVSQPNQAAGAYTFASFIPDKDVTITRIVTPFAGVSFVVTPYGSEPCSRPPYFYLSSGPNRGVLNAAYVLDLPNGAVPSGQFAVDSGPISVEFPAGVEITASYQVGFDATRICDNSTNMGSVPDNFTVQYTTKDTYR